MPQTEFLFIGGHADGQRLTLDNPFDFMKIPVISKTRACSVEETTEMVQAVEADTYLMGKIQAGNRKFFYYRHQELNDEEVIRRLLDDYRPPEPDPLA